MGVKNVKFLIWQVLVILLKTFSIGRQAFSADAQQPQISPGASIFSASLTPRQNKLAGWSLLLSAIKANECLDRAPYNDAPESIRQKAKHFWEAKSLSYFAAASVTQNKSCFILLPGPRSRGTRATLRYPLPIPGVNVTSFSIAAWWLDVSYIVFLDTTSRVARLAPALPANIRPAWKNSPGTNTSLFFPNVSDEGEKFLKHWHQEYRTGRAQRTSPIFPRLRDAGARFNQVRLSLDLLYL